MIHDCVEDYVDDLVVKSKRGDDHFGDLVKVFERCRKYKLKMNPKKCAFGVSAGKFLGVIVHKEGIGIDRQKATAVREMPPPQDQKQLKSFIGKVSYLRRFIPGLAELTGDMLKLLRKGTKAKKSQALADLLAVFPSQGEEIIERLIPGGIAEISIIEANEWELTFDGASTSEGGGVGIVLTNPEGKVTVKAHKLMFGCSNNEAEYEALISGLNLALEAGAKGLIIKGDSKSVIQQVRGEFAVKEPALARYRTIVQQLLENFPQHRLEHVPRTQNRHADALATMASKVEIKKIKTLRVQYSCQR
ncbi:hypothetical protein UlMin_020917 [Ulmus minor]